MWARPYFRPLLIAFAACLSLLCLYLYFKTFLPAYTDDAFIQLKYADTLLNHKEWGFFPNRRANTATSPLNVILTAGIGYFAGTTLEASVWLTAIEFFFIFLVLYGISKQLFPETYFAYFGWIAFAANPLLISTFGLESTLYLLLFVLCLWLFLRQRRFSLMVAAALLTLARPDGLLFSVLLIITMPISWITRLKCFIFFVLVLLPWYLFSWIYLGSVVPDTFFIKTDQAAWGPGISFLRGLSYYYLPRYPVATLSSFLLILLGFFALRNANPKLRAIILLVGVYGLAHFICYSLLGVPPYHWYYVPVMISCVILGSLGMASLMLRWNSIKYLTLLIPAIGFFYLVYRSSGYPLQEAPIHTNWATMSQYREIGLWLRENTDADATFSLGGEIGTLAYFSERQLINRFSDPNSIPRLIERRDRYGAFLQAILTANFYWRRSAPAFEKNSYVLQHDVSGFRQATEHTLKQWKTSSRWIPEAILCLEKAPD